MMPNEATKPEFITIFKTALTRRVNLSVELDLVVILLG
jgi:hypothetical protein